jgi:Protein of unknown function (DUF2889)
VSHPSRHDRRGLSSIWRSRECLFHFHFNLSEPMHAGATNQDPPATLASDVSREPLHLRRIKMRGWRRADGLFEIEGQVIDTKPFEFAHPAHERAVPAGAPIHDMGVRLLIDEQFTVLDVATFTTAAPYPACPEGGRALRSLLGLRMSKGWTRAVRERLGGERSCTHLMELLTPMATTAFQALGVLHMHEPDRLDAHGRPVRIDSCYAYAADGEVVRGRWPAFHRPRQRATDSATGDNE